MGNFDSAETCDLVGLYLLSKLQHLKANLGLYRDDGLGVCALTNRQVDVIKKEICKNFEKHILRITIEVNKKIVDFLDVTFNLETGEFKPFMKPNDTPLYVNRHSNHPPSIIRNLPASINRRLSSISANEGVFKNAIPPYQEALKSSGYETILNFETDASNTSKRRTRGRNITWFNPPYSANVATSIGAKFLKIIDKCFPPTHVLHKIINRNTIKISYRCMPNFSQVLSRHNAKIARQVDAHANPPGCNCQGGIGACPLNGQCKVDKLVYQATVTRTDNQEVETYTGLTAGTFKNRYNKHMSDFRINEHATTLSKYIWQLKREGHPYEVSWKTIGRGAPFNPTTKTCQLCLLEKYLIIFSPEGATLNKRSELYSTCRHRLKELLSKVKP